jgi:glycosyltransferase involved in cell wall biosynthesis
MKTKFSLIVPCYNQSEFIYDCYISIVAQKYYHWEIVFVNDGSTDNTAKLLQSLKQFDKSVIVITKQNGGLSSARNAGIIAASGDFFIFLDCDDMLLPNCLSSINEAIEQNKALDIVQVGYRHIPENAMSILNNVLPNLCQQMLPNILFDNLGPVHSFCISKNLIHKTGQFDESLKSCEDWDYWIRCSTLAKSVFAIQNILVEYRMNEKSMSRDSFVLYDALKNVSLRGKDISKIQNIDEDEIEKKFKTSLKKKLAMCLGVSLSQNKIKDSIDLLTSETQKFQLYFSPNDFSLMSSYLTFRYKTSEQDAKHILQKYKPIFKKFFEQIGYNKSQINKANWSVFSKHHYICYVSKYGTLGKVFFKIKSIMI